jgi:hypothetical protein
VLLVGVDESGALVDGVLPAARVLPSDGVLVAVASSAPCPPTAPPWSSTVLLVGVDEPGAVKLGAVDPVVLDGVTSDVVVTRIVVELGSGNVVTVEVDEGESSTETSVASTNVVSAPGTNAGGGVVLTEFAAAKATPPKVTMAPTPAATVINRFFISASNRGFIEHDQCPLDPLDRPLDEGTSTPQPGLDRCVSTSELGLFDAPVE